jgi:glyoxylase-like metal-dependent hydrolase (beta-lactamase superfamily II)
MAVPCFMVAHPKGTLLWDAGVVPDTDWKPTGASVKHRLTLPNGATRDVTLRKSLAAQLAEVGYSAADVTYLALSHYHYDHTANANALLGATWLVRQSERDAMFADSPPAVTLPSTYARYGTAERASSIATTTTCSAMAPSSSRRPLATRPSTKSSS